MSATSLPQTADSASVAKPQEQNAAPVSAYTDRPLCVHHQGDITVVVYSAPDQEPKRLNHPILPSLHIVLVPEGNEIEGMATILAAYLLESSPATAATNSSAAHGSDATFAHIPGF